MHKEIIDQIDAEFEKVWVGEYSPSQNAFHIQKYRHRLIGDTKDWEIVAFGPFEKVDVAISELIGIRARGGKDAVIEAIVKRTGVIVTDMMLFNKRITYLRKRMVDAMDDWGKLHFNTVARLMSSFVPSHN